jgi:hypothetical protein
MGRIIQKGNNKTTVYVTGVNINGLTPELNTYYLGVDLSSGLYEKLNPSGSIINLEASGSGSFTGGTVPGNTNFTGNLSADTFSATTYLNLPTIEVSAITTTYSGLVSDILSSGLTTGSFYLISDFKTCYDQPNYNDNGSPIMVGNYKQGIVEPILVLATSDNTISSDVYQPAHPNDKLTYDWSFSATEVTNNVAFGRITERVDEFNNRTDYDHKNILFIRYKLYTYRPNQPLDGTVSLLGDGTVNGVGTSFTALTIGDVIYIDNTYPSYYEIISITDDLTMMVSGDTISPISGQVFYNGIEETFGGAHFNYKKPNIKSGNFIEYLTFGDAILNSFAKNNYVGNYDYTDFGVFILPNNLFLGGQYESNKFGNNCFNNTFGTDNQNNIWGEYCHGNVSTNDIDNNHIGNRFLNNIININLVDNKIGNDFSGNKLFGGNANDFTNNQIGNDFTDNTIYSEFYNNIITNGFQYNNILNSFKLNTINTYLTNVNFATSTHVYGDYNCILFRNSGSIDRLSYYDGNDVLNITDVNA